MTQSRPPYTPGIFCQNWDSLKPEYLTDKRTGQTIGRLMPRATAAVLRASRGISRHSIPETDSRTLASQRYKPAWGDLSKGAMRATLNQRDQLDTQRNEDCGYSADTATQENENASH